MYKFLEISEPKVNLEFFLRIIPSPKYKKRRYLIDRSFSRSFRSFLVYWWIAGSIGGDVGYCGWYTWRRGLVSGVRAGLVGGESGRERVESGWMGSVKRVAQLFVSGRACNGLHRRCGCCAVRVERSGAYSRDLSLPASRLDRRFDDGEPWSGLAGANSSRNVASAIRLLLSHSVGMSRDGGSYIRSMGSGHSGCDRRKSTFPNIQIGMLSR